VSDYPWTDAVTWHSGRDEQTTPDAKITWSRPEDNEIPDPDRD
jgi:hypothetical protein